MKGFSRYTAVTLIFSLLISFAIPSVTSAKAIDIYNLNSVNEIKKIVDASSTKTTIVVDEISYVQQLLSYSEDELYDMGCTEEEVEEIQNFDYNTALLELSEKSTYELENIGYSDSQIQNLKYYDGTSDAVSYIQAKGLSNAKLTLNYSPWLVNNQSQFNILWYTSWSSAPIFQGTDIVAVCWQACTKNSSLISMKYRETPTCIVDYYNSSVYCSSVNITPSVSIGSTSFSIPMSKAIGKLNTYAKEVAGNIQLLTQSGSSNLYTIQFLVGYGHSTVTLSPNVTFSTGGTSLDISFSLTMQELKKIAATYKYDGSSY